MTVHWFAITCFSLAGIFMLAAIYCWGRRDDVGLFWLIALIFFFFAGLISSGQAHKQNQGLASRNKKEFAAEGYKVVSAYGHGICVAAGSYKLCLQERKDATGKKQLVAQLANGGWVVVGHGFVNAVANAPHQ